MLEEVARKTTRTSSIKPFQKNKDGQNEFLSMIFKHFGPDEWMVVLKGCDNYLHAGKWKRKYFPVLGLASKHRQSCVEMIQ